MSTATIPQPQTIDLAEIAKSDPNKALELAMAETGKAKRELSEMKTLTSMSVGKDGLEATNSAQLWWLAGIYAMSGAAPKDDTDIKVGGQWQQRPVQEVKARLFIKMSFGAELGMKPLQSIQNIAVINNRPCIWGDAAKAIVISSGLCEYCIEEEVGKIGNAKNPNPDWGFRCRVKRKGQAQEESYTFTWGDAAMAGLLEKNGSLYKLYPKRMLMFRARGFRLRDTFPDVLKGLITAEEARDIETERDTKEHRPSVQELLGDTSEETQPTRGDAESGDTEQPADLDRAEKLRDFPSPANAQPETATAPQQSPEDEAADVAQWIYDLASCNSKSEVSDAEAYIVGKTWSDANKAKARDACKKRASEIGGGRGERSNTKKLFDNGQSATANGM